MFTFALYDCAPSFWLLLPSAYSGGGRCGKNPAGGSLFGDVCCAILVCLHKKKIAVDWAMLKENMTIFNVKKQCNQFYCCSPCSNGCTLLTSTWFEFCLPNITHIKPIITHVLIAMLWELFNCSSCLCAFLSSSLSTVLLHAHWRWTLKKKYFFCK